MANRDDHRGFGGDGGRDRGRQEQRNWDESSRGNPFRGGPEDRTFGDRGRFNSDEARYGRGGSGQGEGEPWRRDRYGSRFDQDRTGYGSGYDRQGGDYGRGQRDSTGRYGAGGVGRGYGGYGGHPNHGAEGRGYGGQEYGMEGGHRLQDQSRNFGGNERETWRPHGSAPYGDLEFNAQASGVEEFGAPHDYAYHPPQGHEFDHDYTHWREEQLRAHDRDYQEWRKHQHQQYDDEYRKFRTERRDTFGKNFHEWRLQRNTTGGMRQQHVEPETGDYARRQTAGFGQGNDQPSGNLESPGAMATSPALSQTGGGQNSPQSGKTSQAGSSGSEFGREPSQVQAVTDGSDGRRADADRKDDENRTDQNRH